MIGPKPQVSGEGSADITEGEKRRLTSFSTSRTYANGSYFWHALRKEVDIL